MARDTKGIVAFLLLTFGIAWTLQLLFVPHLPSFDSPGFIPAARTLGFFGAWAPMVAAIVVRAWVTREGFDDAGLALNLRRRWRYYLAAVTLPWLSLCLVIVMALAFGLAHTDLQIMTNKHRFLPGPDTFVHGIVSLVAYFAVLSVIGGWAAIVEEFGWRGYLQLRIYRSRPAMAAVATGLIWGLWHLPVVLLGGGLPGNRITVILTLCVTAVLMAIITGWLRLRTASVWPACFVHQAFDSSALASTIIFYGHGNLLLVSAAGVLGWIPQAAFCLWIVKSGGLRLPEWHDPKHDERALPRFDR